MSQQASRLLSSLTNVDPQALQQEIDDELALHIELATAEHVREGLAPEEASRRARERFGDPAKFSKQCFRIQTRERIMLQKLHLLLTVVLLIAVLRFASTSQRASAPSAIESAQLLVCDVTKTESERLRGLNWLRFSSSPGVESRNSEVVQSMLQLAEETDNRRVRADVFRQLDGVTDAALKPVLLEALANDPDEEVRSEAAESLAAFAKSDDVAAALKLARDEDSSADVRDQASFSLVQNSSVAKLKAIVMGDSSSEKSKLMALWQLRRLDRSSGDPRDRDVVQAMIELAKSTLSPQIRADIFRQLDEVTQPILEVPLLDALANDPSPEVRSEAAETLASYLGSDAVVKALEKAAAEDDSSEVRDEAKQSLGER